MNVVYVQKEESFTFIFVCVQIHKFVGHLKLVARCDRTMLKVA